MSYSRSLAKSRGFRAERTVLSTSVGSTVFATTMLHCDGSNQTSYHEIVLPLEYQRPFAAYDSRNPMNHRKQTTSQGVIPVTLWNTHRFPYDGIPQQPLWDAQPRPYEYFGHDNNHSRGPWALEQSYPRVDSSFPAGVDLGSLAASSHFHQHWDGTSAPAQTVPKDPGQAVVSLEMAASTPSAGAVDPIQRGSNIGKIAIPVYPHPDGYEKKHFDNETAQKIAEIWGISPECVFYFSPVIDVKCICPIATCTSGLATFQGHTIKDHLARYHPNISKEESIACARVSHKESQCGKRRKKTVQGRHYAQHFREVHLAVHFKCPFCGTTSTRINNLVTHFCKCDEVEKALTME